MKKFIVLPVLAMFLAISSPVLADQCGDISLNHGVLTVTDPDTLLITTIPAVNNLACGSGNPENVMAPWGKNADVPHLKPGEELNFSYFGQIIPLGCPAFMNKYCVDITVTQYWKDRWGQNLVRVPTVSVLSVH